MRSSALLILIVSAFGGVSAIPSQSETENELWDGERFTYSVAHRDGLVVSCELGKRYNRSLSYDKNRNIVCERMRGQLCNGETTERDLSSTYNDCNLCTSQTVGLHTWRFAYQSDPERLTAKWWDYAGETIERHFFIYDEQGFIAEYIKDDGSAADRDDLTSVTSRIIQRYLYSPDGRCLEDHDLYLDLASGCELSLERRVYTYGEDCVQQDVFDAAGFLRYSIFTEGDERGHITRRIDPLGAAVRYAYDEQGRRILEEHSDHTIRYEYMDEGVVRSEISDLVTGEVRDSLVMHDDEGRLIATVDHLGRTTETAYGALDHPVQRVLPPIRTGPEEWERPIHRKKIRQCGQEIIAVDPLGHVTESFLTCEDRPYLRIHPDGSRETWTYSIEGFQIGHIDRRGLETYIERDHHGNELRRRITAPSGAHVESDRQRYEGNRLVELGESMRTYDGAGRLTTLLERGVCHSYSYDDLGRVAEEMVTGPGEEMQCFAFEYDLCGRLLEECRDGEVLHRYRYDSEGRMIGMAIGENEEERFFYNGFGEVVRHISPNGKETRFEYDYTQLEGQLVLCKRITDPRGCVTMVHEDGAGHVVRCEQFDPFGFSLRQLDYFYDLLGRCVEERGIVTTPGLPDQTVAHCYTYDCCGRILSHTEMGEVGRTTRWAYDIAGNHVCTVKPSGVQIEYTYDEWGRCIGLSTGSVSYSLQLDASGNLVQAEGPEGVTTRSYDSSGRCTAETLANGLTIRRAHDERGRLESISLPDGSGVSYEWSGERLLSVSRLVDGEVAYSHFYRVYDLFGHPVCETLPLSEGELVREYDTCGRCTAIRHSAFAEWVDEFDLGGNPLSITYSDDLGMETDEYGYDALGRLISEPTAVYEIDSRGFRVCNEGVSIRENRDIDGRLVSRGGLSFQYDDLDRLIEVSSSERTITYTYDFADRRMTCSSDGVTTRFLYDGEFDIGECDSDGDIVSLRVLGNGVARDVGAAIAIELEGEVFVPIHDRRGCVRVLLSSGSVVQSYRYTAFGECEASAPQVYNPFLFSSKHTDVRTGLAFFGHRYYDPSAGVWLTSDPMGYRSGTNPYTYCLHNPLSRLDPQGLWDDYYPIVESDLIDPLLLPFFPPSILFPSTPEGPTYQPAQPMSPPPCPSGGGTFHDKEVAPRAGRHLGQPGWGQERTVSLVPFAKAVGDWIKGIWKGGKKEQKKKQEERARRNEVLPSIPVDRREEVVALMTGAMRRKLYLLQAAGPKELKNFLKREGYANKTRHVEAFHIEGLSTPGLAIFLVHGINNSLEEAKGLGRYVSALSGGSEVHGLHYRGNGVPTSWGEYSDGVRQRQEAGDALAMIMEHAVLPVVERQIEMWRSYFRENPDGKILQICHSCGAAVVRNALMACEEFRDRIMVIAVAPAARIPSGYCRASVNIFTSNDAVPRTDLYGMCLPSNDVVINLPGWKLFCWEHSIYSKKYINFLGLFIMEYESRCQD